MRLQVFNFIHLSLISMLSQKRGFNGLTGVIRHADWEFEIIVNCCYSWLQFMFEYAVDILISCSKGHNFHYKPRLTNSWITQWITENINADNSNTVRSTSFGFNYVLYVDSKMLFNSYLLKIPTYYGCSISSRYDSISSMVLWINLSYQFFEFFDGWAFDWCI